MPVSTDSGLQRPDTMNLRGCRYSLNDIPMNPGHFQQTVIGSDYLNYNRSYPIDMLLDYLLGLKSMKEDSRDNKGSYLEYELEIQATKEILKRVTSTLR